MKSYHLHNLQILLTDLPDLEFGFIDFVKSKILGQTLMMKNEQLKK